MAGRTYAVDRLPKAKRDKVRQELIDKTSSLRAITDQYNLKSKSNLSRYRDNVLTEEIAEQSTKDKRAVVQHFIERIDGKVDQLEKVLRAIDRELADQDGEYDLSNVDKATPYVRMLNDTVRTLSGIVKDVAQIQESIQETAELNARPELFIAFICQVLQQIRINSEQKGEILERLRQIQTNIDRRNT